MNRMARQRNDLLTAPSMAVLRRPLTDAEARRLKGESVIDHRKAVAELARIMESDDEYAAEVVERDKRVAPAFVRQFD